MLREILERAVSQGASDVHMAPGAPPFIRVDGILKPLEGKLSPEDVERAVQEILPQEDIDRLSKDKEIETSFSIHGLSRFRLSVCFQRGTLSISIRVLPFKIPKPEELGIPDIAKSLVEKERGLIVVTGPAGSGKSTTIASLLEYMNMNLRRRIVTIEDPIEYLFENKKCHIIQREIGRDALSFPRALRHALRQDPDVIFIGEMREPETMGIALTAAETGHLVLSTLHTSGAVEALARIIDAFPPHERDGIRLQLSEVIEGVLFQRLLPKREGGRVAVFETLVGSKPVRNLVREGKLHQIRSFMEMGRDGMQTFEMALQKLKDLVA